MRLRAHQDAAPLLSPRSADGTHSADTSYRSDIDGLRALAVLAVILFHATRWAPGGFVGVDVFFVISGFLITGQIAADLDEERFSLATFWGRRVRRIWPAAFVVTCAVLTAGWFVMVPKDYATTAGDAQAQAIMLANVHLWKNVEQGYFAPSSDLRPLLHMWSLAVEEQFYVFLPLVMMVAWRYGRRRCAWLLGALALASLVLGVRWLPSQPKAVFYLLPFRAWELLIGSLVALVSPWRHGTPDDQPDVVPRPAWPRLLAEVGSMLGLGLILVSSLAYTKNTTFPAAAAMPPCIGAALIIAACARPSGSMPLVNRMLAVQPLPMIGRLSYSLYLWHWPVLAFMRYCLVEPSVRWTSAAMVAVVPVAYLAWRWIEQPFRIRPGHADADRPVRSMTIAAWRPVLVGTIAWIAVYMAGGLIAKQRGMDSRFNAVERQFIDSSRFVANRNRLLGIGFKERHNFLDRSLRMSRDGDVFPKIGAESAPGGPDFLLWGDSHARAISDVVDSAARRHGVYGHAALMGGTVPLPGVWNGSKHQDLLVCEKWSATVIDWIRIHRPRHVVVCGNWATYPRVRRIDGDGRRTDPVADVLADALKLLIGQCDAVGARVTLLLQVPTQDLIPAQRVIRAHLAGRPIDLSGVSRAVVDRQQANIAAAVAIVASERLRVINLADPFFGPNGVSVVGDDGGSWYFDRDHVSAYGAERRFTVVLEDMMGIMAAERSNHVPSQNEP